MGHPCVLREPLHILSEALHRGVLEEVRETVEVWSIAACKAVDHGQGGKWSHQLVQDSPRDGTQQRRGAMKGCRGQFTQETESSPRAVHPSVQPHIAEAVDRRKAYTEDSKPDERIVDKCWVRGCPYQGVPHWGPDASGQGCAIVERPCPRHVDRVLQAIEEPVK